MRLKQGHVLAAGCIVLFVIAVLLLVLQGYSHRGNEGKKMTIGVLLQGGFAEKGWNHRNYEGIQEAAETLGLQLDSRENLPADSADVLPTLQQMAASDQKLVFLASADYADDMMQAKAKGSPLVFAIPSLEQPPDERCVPYFVRLYQGEYLAGMLAGMHTKNNRIGYVASMPVPETIRCIDAFTLGARRMNPQAEVVVYWIGSWDNANKEIHAAHALIESASVDVLNSHQDRAYVQHVAEQSGIDYFSYQDPFEGASEHNLATVTCDWSVVYQKILQDYQQGQLQNLYWVGLVEGAVDLADYSAAVTETEKQEIEIAKQEIRGGHTIFSGEIHDLQGNRRCAPDETISDATLIHMNWFVEGVKFYE